MLAAVAALLFLIALILDLASVAYSNALVVAGLLCIALSMAGVGGAAPRFMRR